MTILFPQLIVEVLSKSTEQFDRTDKFLDYQQLPTLEEYVLVSQDSMQVECYRKQPDGTWAYQHYGAGDVVTLESFKFQCAIASIYNKVSGHLVL